MLTDISKVIDFEQIKTFSTTGSRTTIHDLKYLSLFIREGEKLRKYAQETGNAPAYKILELDGCHFMGFHAEFNPFDSKSLTSFCKKTGVTEIREMVKETVELLEYFRQNNNSNNSKGNLQFYITEIRKDLFSRLSKYHPELVYEHKNNSGLEEEIPKEDADEAPEPTEEGGDEPYPKGFPADPKSNPPYEF
jgi:hypothetical protein